MPSSKTSGIPPYKRADPGLHTWVGGLRYMIHVHQLVHCIHVHAVWEFPIFKWDGLGVLTPETTSECTTAIGLIATFFLVFYFFIFPISLLQITPDLQEAQTLHRKKRYEIIVQIYDKSMIQIVPSFNQANRSTY